MILERSKVLKTDRLYTWHQVKPRGGILEVKHIFLLIILFLVWVVYSVGWALYPDSNSVKYNAYNNIVQYPIHNDSVQYPAHNDTVQYPIHNGSVEYPAYNESIQYPSYNDSVQYPAYNDSVQYPAYNDSIQFLVCNDSVQYPAYNDSIQYPVYNDSVQYPAYLDSTAESLVAYHNLTPEDDTSLIDLHNFKFLINNPKCNASSPPFIIAVVHSALDHELNRKIIRETWGQDLHLVFLVAKATSAKDQEIIELENNKHHDLIQGNFLDTYRNLTYKHVMGLKWVTYYCPGAKYMLKTDDDVFVNTPFMKEFLTTRLIPHGDKYMILCNVHPHNPVYRDDTKWKVTVEEYSDEFYPPYCTGYAIIYSTDVVFELYREAQQTKYFWIDDVFVTGILTSKINITLTPVTSLAIIWYDSYEFVYKDEFLFFLASSSYHERLWKMVNTPSNLTLSRTWKAPWDS